jgi:hypothetical protein
MIRKIVSNGRTGVSRGALDAAMDLDIPHSGWTICKDPAHKEPLPEKYHLQEMKTKDIAKCVERNVKDSDGTLIIIFSDKLPDDALCAKKSAGKHHMPLLKINLSRMGEFEAAQAIHEWLKEYQVASLHVVGAIQGNSGEMVNQTTAGLLEAVYYLGLIENNMTGIATTVRHDQEVPPTSIEDIVTRISTEMSLKDRVVMANLQEPQLELLQPTLGRYILRQLEQWQKAHAPTFSLSEIEPDAEGIDGISLKVTTQLWMRLRETHRLRIVK